MLMKIHQTLQLITLILFIRRKIPVEPLFGVYRQEKKLDKIKFVLFFLLLKFRILIGKSKQKVCKIIGKKFELVRPNEEIDRAQPLSSNINAIDAVYFNGSNKDKSALIFATARRTNKLVNGFAIIRIPEFSDMILVSPRMPDTCMYQTEEELGSYQVEGISLTPLVPMKSWKIEYNGKMKFEEDNSQVFDVKIDAEYSTDLPHFNYDTDMNPTPTAKAIAKEPWSREYFEQMKILHQTHYEQYGEIKGHAIINNKKYNIFVKAVRDHSFGEFRDWKNFHRYVMHFFTLENGDGITFGIVSIPATFSTLLVGFITTDGKNYPITESDFQLYQHGEAGEPPKNYSFTFKAGSKEYLVQVKENASSKFCIGLEAEARFVEMLCEFDVNGIKGWGAAEWHYRNLTGLPKNHLKSE